MAFSDLFIDIYIYKTQLNTADAVDRPQVHHFQAVIQMIKKLQNKQVVAMLMEHQMDQRQHH